MTTSLVTTATWRVVLVWMLNAFFTSILIHFIHFRHILRHRGTDTGTSCKVLDYMAPLKQMLTIYTQLLSQMKG